MKTRSYRLLHSAVVIGVLAFVLAGSLSAGPFDINLTEKEWAKLETFEAHSLSKADKSHAQKKWREAVAEYDSFVIEFPKSRAISYSLVKKGLSLEADDKRYKAIEAYTEVLDYFPNDIPFAAPALYFIGRCHYNNGELQKALQHWAEMADDEDYSLHPLAAYAINSLASNLMKQDRVADAVKYYRQVAVDFRETNVDARNKAIPSVVTYYMRTKPNEPELRKFYREARTFHGRLIKVPEDLSKDWSYWSTVLSNVEGRSRFSEEDRTKNKHKPYFEYWGKQVDGKFLDNDDYQKRVIDLWYAGREDRAAWHKRLDRQFEQHQKDGDYDRITKWIVWNRSFPEKVKHYYAKYNFEKMTNKQIISVIKTFYRQVGDKELARNLISKIRFDKMSDGQVDAFARSLWAVDDPMVEPVCRNIEDIEFAKMHVLSFFDSRFDALTDGQHKRCVPLALELTQVDKYAQEAWWIKARFHHRRGQYEQAIASYQQCDDPIRTVWEIVACYEAWPKPKQAIQELTEIEAMFQKHGDWSPRAALHIAHVYKRMKQRKSHVSGLRRVLKQYPKSGQSSSAHVELERMGESVKVKGEDEQLVKTGGGVDAE